MKHKKEWIIILIMTLIVLAIMLATKSPIH